MEDSRRRMLMLKKSEAVSKFETAMSSTLQVALQKSVILTLCQVRQPIFNKALRQEDLDDLTNNWHKIGGKKSYHKSSKNLAN